MPVGTLNRTRNWNTDAEPRTQNREQRTNARIMDARCTVDMKWCQDTARPTPEIEPWDVAPVGHAVPKDAATVQRAYESSVFPVYPVPRGWTACGCGRARSTRARRLPIATPHTTGRTWHSARDAQPDMGC